MKRQEHLKLDDQGKGGEVKVTPSREAQVRLVQPNQVELVVAAGVGMMLRYVKTLR